MLYYPTFYEGLEQSKNVIYTGQEATQQIIAGLDWVNKTKGAKSFYLLAPTTSAAHVEQDRPQAHRGHLQGCKVVGEEYFPLGSTQFNSVINKIKLTKPDVIYAIIVGGSNVAFYKQLKAAGIDLSKQTLLTISVTEDEIDGIGGENIAGAYACMKYFQSLDNPTNKASCPRQEDVGREDRDRRRDAGGLSRSVAVEVDRREGGQLRHRQDRGRLARRRVQGCAGRLCPHPREPSSLVEDPRRQGQARWSVRADLRDRRPKSSRIRSPRAISKNVIGESLSFASSSHDPARTPWRGLSRPTLKTLASRIRSRRGTSDPRLPDPRLVDPRLAGPELSDDGERIMFGDYSLGDLGAILAMQGFAGLILFSVTC